MSFNFGKRKLIRSDVDVSKELLDMGEWVLYARVLPAGLASEMTASSKEGVSTSKTYGFGQDTELYAVQVFKRSSRALSISDGKVVESVGNLSTEDAEFILPKELYPKDGDFIVQCEWNKSHNDMSGNIKVTNVLNVWKIMDVEFPYLKGRDWARVSCINESVRKEVIQDSLPQIKNLLHLKPKIGDLWSS